MSDKRIRRVDLFVSSPGDLSAERREIARVADELNRMSHVRGRYHLDVHAYEEETPPLLGEAPQRSVDRFMLRPADADVFVCMLRSRMGTPVEDPATGERFDSGTAFELACALRAWRQRSRPHLLLYRCTRAAPDADAAQLASVEAFFARLEAGDGELRGLYKRFESVAELHELVFHDLDALIGRGELEDRQTPITILGMESNDGWTLTFQLAEGAAEIEYRLGSSEEWRSTGTGLVADPRTGRPVPNTFISVSEIPEPLEVGLRYRDLYGEPRGPFELVFDPRAAAVGSARYALETLINGWVAFRLWHGELLVYFTLLLSHKHALREIRWSIDDESLERSVAFSRAASRARSVIGDDDETYVAIPLDARWIAVRLGYDDGTQSAIRRFPVPQGLVDEGLT